MSDTKNADESVHSAPTSLKKTEEAMATTATTVEPTREFDATLCAKIDRRIFPPMFLLNFLSLMGRTNIGSALIQKLPQDLKLDATQVFLVVVMPLIMLIVFDIPSNLIMRWFERKLGLAYMRYLSLITVLLGMSRILSATVWDANLN